ncbi:GbsR/MarR family transcriptional regulator [Planotetraspora mira]|nr:MarR family transcriptional regulator [Planotetraspora mira]
MTTPDELAFTDRMAHFYAREYGFPPVAGRVLGYLLICRPPQQTIDEIGAALLASRSAVTGAVTLLAGHHVVRRSRSAGQRVDHVTLDPRALDPTGFAGATYQEQATLAREALDLLEEGPSERRSMLEEGAAFYDFLAERMPALLSEWHARRDARHR